MRKYIVRSNKWSDLLKPFNPDSRYSSERRCSGSLSSAVFCWSESDFCIFSPTPNSVTSFYCARLPPSLVPGIVAEQFLNNTATQLTYHGLCELTSTVQEGELCVFFRNNHFSTMIKFKVEATEKHTYMCWISNLMRSGDVIKSVTRNCFWY